MTEFLLLTKHACFCKDVLTNSDYEISWLSLLIEFGILFFIPLENFIDWLNQAQGQSCVMDSCVLD